MNILITGGTGQVGQSLLELVWPDSMRLFAPVRSHCDLADLASMAACLDSQYWTAVINAGAYTAVDKAESDQAAAWAINAKAPEQLARFCAHKQIPLIHISTDYVFSGQGTRAWREDDATAPLGVYGASKLAGEQAVMGVYPKAVVLRTAWVISAFGHNFLKTMLRLAADRDQLRVVADQFGCPTSAHDLAKVIQTILLRQLTQDDTPGGLFHAVNAGETHWAGLARHVFATSLSLDGPFSEVIDIPSSDYPTPAKRPANSRLDCTKLNHHYGLKIRPWTEAVAEIVSRLVDKKGSAS
ncbi:MAG: dTDP-4-dehydrorhamnose reductase [Rhizobiales bacterium]|nr:dTDP-4-dehydrorhamnose reductase [Hyphomicrobiales bacterium]